MSLVVTNTLTGEKEPFEPLNPPEVKLYVCGLTVYDYSHIGHARTYVAWDIIRRHLEHKGYRVTHVQNVTDVDDKIIARANETGADPLELARRFTEEADKDFDALGVKRAHHYPRVSDNIDGIIRMTQDLIDKGHAYAGEDEHGTSVYFSVEADADYGKLSRLNREELLAGVRKGVAEGKRHPADFALWKAAKPGEVSWDSPWGKGRPGWHIECSVMATKLLGASFDMHGGGQDLVFPHHENELAQSESATGVEPFVKYWVHTGFLTVEGEKMSKSLGNFVTVRDALKDWRPEVLRIWLAGTHYRSPIDYSEAGLKQAERSLERIENLLANAAHAVKDARAGPATDADAAFLDAVKAREAAFEEAMDNDFNAPLAMATVFELVTDLNKYLGEDPHKDTLQHGMETFRTLADVLGMLPFTAPEGGVDDATVSGLMDLLLEVRQGAREKKDFATADRIRDRLGELGFIIEDSPKGAKWRRK